MAAWITSAQVQTILQTDLSEDDYVDDLILHAQSLAVAEIGEQDLTPPADGAVPSPIQSVLAQIVARMWRGGRAAQMNPAALQSETTGPFTFQDTQSGSAGLGLTNREIASLRKAAGMFGLGTLSTTRGDIETPSVINRRDDVIYSTPTSTDQFGDGAGWDIGGAP